MDDKDHQRHQHHLHHHYLNVVDRGRRARAPSQKLPHHPRFAEFRVRSDSPTLVYSHIITRKRNYKIKIKITITFLATLPQ